MTQPQTQAQPAAQPLTSLSTKIIFFVFLSTFLTALVISWVSIQSTHAYLRQQINQAFPALAERAAERTQTWMEEQAEGLAKGWLGGSLERELTAAQRASRSQRRREAVQQRLEAALARLEAFDALAVFDAGGAPWIGAGTPPLTGVDPGTLLADAPEGIAFRTPGDDDEASLVAVRVLADAEGEPTGVLVARFRREALASLLGSVRGDRGAALYLARPDGVLVAGAVDRPAPGPATQAAAPGELWQGVREYTGVDGSHVLGSAEAIPGVDLWAVVEAPFEQAFAPVLSVVTRIFVIDLGIIVLFSFVAYRITSAIVRPIEALSAAARRISQGRVDHEIPDPQTNDEIGLLTRAFNDMIAKLRRNQETIESANEQLTEQNEQLQRANEVLAQLSITDGLTKLHNHRFFQDHLTREIKRARRTGESLSMLLCDLDDFKQLNDRLGHAAGDELLERVARLMETSMRDSDLLARYGGEEFVVLASNTDLPGAVKLAEKIRATVKDASHLLDDTFSLTRVTVSIGVALYKGDRKKFFQSADQALYRAKAQGKNCVVAADD